MRLDVFLKLSRLVPRRTFAKEMRDAGAVKLNGLRAKTVTKLRTGEVRTGGSFLLRWAVTKKLFRA